MDARFVIPLVLFCALLGACGQVFFKLASEQLSFHPADLMRNWKLFLGLSLYGISTVLFVFALKFGNLSFIYPIIATSYVWVALFSFVFLHEHLPMTRIIGIIILIFGVILVAK